jgi:DNA-binding XRE family transcriptional regulator
MQEYIYVMSCASLPHMVKIGYSNDCLSRASALGSSSPTPFIVEKTWQTQQAQKLESFIHKTLDFCRISSDREFFALTTKKAIATIDAIIKEGKYSREILDTGNADKISDEACLGELIKRERKKQGLSQKQLAFAAGTGLRLIGEIESGKKTAQIGKFFIILKLLKIDIFAKQKSI